VSTAIKRAAELGRLAERPSINFLPNDIYRPEICIRTTLEAAPTHGFPVDRLIFEVTEGERVEDGPWFASILREYKRIGLLTAVDGFAAGHAGLKLLSDFKLDMDLNGGLDADAARRHIVNHLVRLCTDLGIMKMQGYLFARPAMGPPPSPDWHDV
jgi:EAL domain-containing protein (putative c-di-GMP-specific phosphodiesterase class I)